MSHTILFNDPLTTVVKNWRNKRFFEASSAVLLAAVDHVSVTFSHIIRKVVRNARH